LPDTRASITHKFNIAGHEGYLTVGLYEDAMPGVLFITMAKEGSTIGGLMDSLGTAVSVALQYGVPIESLVNKFTHQRFEPAGMTANRDIPFAKSLVDYIFRWMGMEFIPGYREATAPRRAADGATRESDLHQTVVAGGSVRAESEDAPVRHGGVPRPINGVKEDQPWRNEDQSGDRAESAAMRPDDPGTRRAPEEQHNGQSKEHPSHAARQAPAPGGGTVVLVETVRATTRVHRTHNGTEIVRTASMAGSATTALSLAMQNNMGDAPACDGCGAITVRSGTCYKCLNCGNSMGCS
jgi:ribonucleoside-diphosphate reductase alpha chain